MSEALFEKISGTPANLSVHGRKIIDLLEPPSELFGSIAEQAAKELSGSTPYTSYQRIYRHIRALVTQGLRDPDGAIDGLQMVKPRALHKTKAGGGPQGGAINKGFADLLVHLIEQVAFKPDSKAGAVRNRTLTASHSRHRCFWLKQEQH